jgi:hypothetical protein
MSLMTSVIGKTGRRNDPTARKPAERESRVNHGRGVPAVQAPARSWIAGLLPIILSAPERTIDVS